MESSLLRLSTGIGINGEAFSGMSITLGMIFYVRALKGVIK